MIEIEVGEDDVADVGRGEAEAFDLADRRLLHAQADVEHGAHRAGDARPRRAVGVVDVLQSVAGVDEHQPGVRLDEQAVADQPAERALAASVEEGAAERAVGAAIEVVDPHGVASFGPGGNARGADPAPRRAQKRAPEGALFLAMAGC